MGHWPLARAGPVVILRPMNDLLTILLIVAAWLVFSRVILPKLGINP